MGNVTDITGRRRQPRGVSTGGQFSAGQKGEAPISLAVRRKECDTRTGFIFANPVPGNQEIIQDMKKVQGEVREVLTYTAGDGAKAVVIPDATRPDMGRILSGTRVDRALHGVFCSGNDKLVENILKRQDSNRMATAARAAGIPTRGEEYNLTLAHRSEDGKWKLNLRTPDSDPRSFDGAIEVLSNPVYPEKTGMRAADGRQTGPLTGGAELDMLISRLTGKPGDTAQELFARAEARYQRDRAKAGL